ncbi:DGQHR domain-containing protein [Sphingomonas sp.]|uniref:DGQHR domain-containing protein n=1 Tax=Sphingomonas sp. TaxID=28214 RepID=UPI002DD61E5B|nr:DGQHR domain-containing protein [Sphingomonas sp.]
MAQTVYPLRVPALRVDQPVGTFFAVVLTARTLLDVAFSDVVSAKLNQLTGGYDVDGAQRLSDPRRLDAIARYINRVDASFPNSIILAANMHSTSTRIEGDIDVDDDEQGDEAEEQAELAKRWSIEQVPPPQAAEGPQAGAEANAVADAGLEIAVEGEEYFLTIPTSEKLAAVIDGQHRLFAFARADPARLDDRLLCSVFIDLPKSMQAQIFATINSNQKAVDKSLTYELFGYNLADEPEDQWSPEKLAVFLARRIATDPDSKMKGRVAVAPVNDFASAAAIAKSTMKISFAVIVGGIVRLISSNPKEDANKLKKTAATKRSALPLSKPPLRSVYIEGDDAFLYAATRNFLNACDTLFWAEAPPSSFIRKTVGVQALFDIYREIAKSMFEEGDMTEEAFIARLQPAAGVDFANVRFQNASGSNRTAIRRIIRVRMGLLSANELPPGDEQFL